MKRGKAKQPGRESNRQRQKNGYHLFPSLAFNICWLCVHASIQSVHVHTYFKHTVPPNPRQNHHNHKHINRTQFINPQFQSQQYPFFFEINNQTQIKIPFIKHPNPKIRAWWLVVDWQIMWRRMVGLLSFCQWSWCQIPIGHWGFLRI